MAEKNLDVVYGSVTGNTQSMAEELASDARARRINVRLIPGTDYPIVRLPHSHLFLVCSIWFSDFRKLLLRALCRGS